MSAPARRPEQAIRNAMQPRDRSATPAKDVQGGSFQQKTKFYTDLWHVLLGRHKIDDSNGEYPDYLGIFLSHELSGTWQCAKLAADLANVDNVLFVDSATVCLGESLEEKLLLRA